MAKTKIKSIKRRLVEFFRDALTFVLVGIKRQQFKNLTIRKGTSNLDVFRSIFLYEEFKLPIRIQPGLIIDAGAYAGFSTLYFSAKYPKAQIIAVEPEKSNYEMLMKHVEARSHVQTINAAIWNKNAGLRIIDRGTGKWGFMVKEVSAEDEYDVKAITIKSILDQSSFDRIGLLKIDIEGSEQELFSSDTEEWLPKVDVLYIELHDRIKKDCSRVFYAAINEYGQWKEFKRGEKAVLIRKDLVEW